jgi:hypothetical protein
MAITTNDLMMLSPIYISAFMLLTSLFNGDVKALIWIVFIIVGIVIINLIVYMKPSLKTLEGAPPINVDENIVLVQVISNYPKLSISSFFIIFTLTYLFIPMMSNNDWNYYVIFGFLVMFLGDTLFKLKQHYAEGIGIILGSVIGALFGIACYSMIHYTAGDKLLYYNTISSNNVYCSRPKKQQFKCYVYKNGEIISTV